MTQQEKFEKLKMYVGNDFQIGKISRLTGIKIEQIFKFIYKNKPFSKKEENLIDETLKII